MKFGLTYPHRALGTGQEGPREFVRAAEEAGFDYLTSAEHVLGADKSTRPDWQGQYSTEDPWREVFVQFGFLSGFTTLELNTSVLVVPQRQTALVAKQAAEVDLLCNGNLRLGFGIGWNEVEYASVGADFRTRGARLEEQVEVLRLLWTQPVVKFDGRFHHLDRVGINPLPKQSPIPIWLGGWGGGERGKPLDGEAIVATFNPVLDRIGRLADGWIGGNRVADRSILEPTIAYIRQAAEKVGRDPMTIGVQCSMPVAKDDLDSIEGRLEQWQKAGITHLTVENRYSGLSLQEHVDVIGRVGEILRKSR